MDDCPEIVLKKLCSTCLSDDRKLYQLCRVADGINDLYWLLSYDSEAYREGFFKDTANLSVCWECRALLRRVARFRAQACVAQRRLARGADIKSKHTSLSQLAFHHKSTYDLDHTSERTTDQITDNFIDCGLVADMKSEDDDIPLSELHNNDDTIDNEIENDLETSLITNSLIKTKIKKKKKAKVKLKKISSSPNNNKDQFTTTRMSEQEMMEIREKQRLKASFIDAQYKCDTCIEGYKTQNDLDSHILDLHKEKPNHTQCKICQAYVKTRSMSLHRSEHYSQIECTCCEFVCYSVTDVHTHLEAEHVMESLDCAGARKKEQRKTSRVQNPGSKPRRSQAMMDKRTPFGYLCGECGKYFDNKNQRWKHVQRWHREGFQCGSCDKRFAFKNNLARHALTHEAPPPREECAICHKMIRIDLLKIHARIHSQREHFSCLACSKRFVSRASYEHHLKYTQAHAAADVLKYKCDKCDKGYRSRGELRDHHNYQHMHATRHQCPECGKALATRRCITRHVRRAHRGVKESARDQVCQRCGKAFRDKKGLREHEFIHTGERPLSCEVCGCTFRQSASLYTHRKRVHKIYPPKKDVQILGVTVMTEPS